MSPNQHSVTMAVTIADSVRDRHELDALLRGFAWTRLGVAGLLAIIVPNIPADLMPRTNAAILLFVLPVVVASSAALLLRPSDHPRRTAWYLCLLDVVLITAVVAATGSARSILGFLYGPAWRATSPAGAALLWTAGRYAAPAATPRP